MISGLISFGMVMKFMVGRNCLCGIMCSIVSCFMGISSVFFIFCIMCEVINMFRLWDFV